MVLPRMKVFSQEGVFCLLTGLGSDLTSEDSENVLDWND